MSHVSGSDTCLSSSGTEPVVIMVTLAVSGLLGDNSLRAPERECIMRNMSAGDTVDNGDTGDWQ